MATYIEQFKDYSTSPNTADFYRGIQARAFQYDQLHRIKKSTSFQLNEVFDCIRFDFGVYNQFNTRIQL